MAEGQEVITRLDNSAPQELEENRMAVRGLVASDETSIGRPLNVTSPASAERDSERVNSLATGRNVVGVSKN